MGDLHIRTRRTIEDSDGQLTKCHLTYASDNLYQLLSAQQGQYDKESYTSDPVGNRLSSL